MEKRIVIKPLCLQFDVDNCQSDNMTLEQKNHFCTIMTPLSCPELLCNNCICKLGTKVNYNGNIITFPCDECDSIPSEQGIHDDSLKMVGEGLGVV